MLPDGKISEKPTKIERVGVTIAPGSTKCNYNRERLKNEVKRVSLENITLRKELKEARARELEANARANVFEEERAILKERIVALESAKRDEESIDIEEKKVALEMQLCIVQERENELARVAQRLFEDNMNLVTALSGRAARAAYVAKLSEEKFMHIDE
jgi:ABC-type thiamine transport system ATPase subunit